LQTIDPDATRQLFAARVPCVQAVAEDRDIFVGAVEDGTWDLGILGLLNGIIGAENPTRIAGWLNDNGLRTGFSAIGSNELPQKPSG
jgi:hypothetical protein